MKKLLILLLLALPAIAAAQTESTQPSKLEWFPVGGGFRSPVADPAEPRVLVGRLNVTRDTGKFQAARASIGYDFGLMQLEGRRADDGWQLGVFGSIDSIFNLDLPGDALVNTDYRIGIPLSWRRGAFSARARVYHQSSHLGDELILGGNAPPRISLSYQAIDALAALQYGGWRVYGGGGYAFTSSTPIYDKTGSAQLGFDYVGTRSWLLGMRLTGGVDIKWLEAADWRSGTSVKVGTMLGRYSPDRRGLTFFLEYYDGFSPFGQFFVQDVKYYGGTLQFDF
jgi:opacity protein-like surface antigen